MEIEKALLQRAEKDLNSAKILFKYGEIEDAVSRAYYAMFYAAKTLLCRKNLNAKTHRGVIVLFTKLVKDGVVEPEYADMLRKGFDLRQLGDYDVYIEFSAEEVEELIKDAEKFLKRVKEILSQNI